MTEGASRHEGNPERRRLGRSVGAVTLVGLAVNFLARAFEGGARWTLFAIAVALWLVALVLLVKMLRTR
jgi:hypothetical protein